MNPDPDDFDAQTAQEIHVPPLKVRLEDED